MQQLAGHAGRVTEGDYAVRNNVDRADEIGDLARALNEIRRMKGITIVVSEQVLSFAMDVADRLFVIEGGRLVHETARDKTDESHIKAYLSV